MNFLILLFFMLSCSFACGVENNTGDSISEHFVSVSLPAFSPDGRYEYVLNQDDDGDEYFYLIYPSGHPEKAVRTPKYSRGVSLVFSPDSKHFALNWHACSNEAHPLIFRMEEKGNPIEIKYTVSGREGESFTQLDEQFWSRFVYVYDVLDIGLGDHTYCWVLGWLDNDTVLVGGCGHGFEAPRLSVDRSWCQLYSLKTGTMTGKLEQYNERCRSLPVRMFPPTNEDGPNAVQKESKWSMALEVSEGGQTFSGNGKIGMILSPCRDGKYLFLNQLREGRGTCFLWQRGEGKNYAERQDGELTDSFVHAAGWQLPEGAVTCVQALCSLDDTHFIIQGYATDPGGKQIAWSTLLFDVERSVYTSSSREDERETLNDYNDSRILLLRRTGE